MSVKVLTQHHLEFLSLKRGCIGSSESTLIKVPNCSKSHVMAQILVNRMVYLPSRIEPHVFNTRESFLRMTER